MELKHINTVDTTGRKILIRVDFNIEFDETTGTPKETFKIAAAKETIDFLLSKERTKVALLTHLGRPEGVRNPKFSTKTLITEAEKLLGRRVHFVSDCIGPVVEDALATLPEEDVLLLENVRFYPEEEKRDFHFSQNLAKPFHMFVNDAFSVSHRNQASVTGITMILPSYAGFQLIREIEHLDRVRSNPDHPAIAIIGGAKVETKLPLIKALEKNYDWILVGGKVANEAIDQKITFSEKVLLPTDFDSDKRLDIGPKTIQTFVEKISGAKTVVWNGPMGKFEETPYDTGTNAILDAILKSDAFSVMGGGESLGILEKRQVFEKIKFVSTGGGAMLEFLSGKQLPGIEVLLH